MVDKKDFKIMREIVFFENADIKVTNTRFISSGKTVALSGVTSVATYEKKPSYILPIVLAVIGVILLDINFVFGLGSLGLGIVLFFNLKPEYSVRLEVASGSIDGFTSKDKVFIDSIVYAVNEAIIHRG